MTMIDGMMVGQTLRCKIEDIGTTSLSCENNGAKTILKTGTVNYQIKLMATTH